MRPVLVFGLPCSMVKEAYRMLETLLESPFFLKRHRQAPLLKEREAFLHHLQRQGTSRPALQDLSNALLHILKRRDIQSPVFSSSAIISELFCQCFQPFC